MTFFKSAFYILVANAIVLAASFFLRPFTARFLGPSEYGLFALILSTATVIPAFTLFSLNNGVLYYSAKNPGKKKEIASSVLVLGLLISIILFLPLQYAILQFVPALGLEGFFISFFLSIGLLIFSVLQAVQQGLEQFGEYSKYSVLSTIVAGVASVVVAYYWHSGLLSALARTVAVFAISLAGLIAIKAVGRINFKAIKSMIKNIWEYSAPLGFAGLVAAFIVVVDRYFLAAYRTTAEVGYYDIAYSMVTAVLPFSGALLIVMMPKLIKQRQNLSLYYDKLGRANTLLLSAIGLFFFYYSDIIATLLLGYKYQAVSLPFKILALALPLMSFYGLNGASMNAIAKTKIAGLLSALLTVFSIVFNFFLVPSFGAVGASIANFFTYVAIVSLGFYYLEKKLSLEIRGSFPQHAIFFAFALLYFVFLGNGGIMLKTAFFAAFLVISYLANKPLIEEMIDSLKKLLANRIF